MATALFSPMVAYPVEFGSCLWDLQQYFINGVKEMTYPCIYLFPPFLPPWGVSINQGASSCLPVS